jgi:hypothetical protein
MKSGGLFGRKHCLGWIFSAFSVFGTPLAVHVSGPDVAHGSFFNPAAG